MVQEQIRDGDSLLGIALRHVPQIKQQLLDALLLQLLYVIGKFDGFAFGERKWLQVANVVFERLF